MRKRQALADAAPGTSAETLLALYLTMLRIRSVEERIADLLEPPSEIICPVHLYTGQEAVATGVCANLRPDDVVHSTHRSHGHYLAKGGSLKGLFAELYGKSTGCSRGRGGSMHLSAPELGFPGSSAIVAGTISLAVGAALAFSVKRKDSVAVAFFGDGAANEGAFYESMNLASLRKLPVIFVCENNLYATHMPAASCLAGTQIYRKAEAFNMPGTRIDGNNVSEVYQVAGKAIEAARHGAGPALIECMTYRWRGHVGPNFDVDKGLRSRDELDLWMSRCPVRNLEQALLQSGILSPQHKAELYSETQRDIDEALAFAKESPLPDRESLLDCVYRDIDKATA